jgi:hypothetical protein
MAAKPYRPKMTAAEKKAYKNRNFGVAGKTGGMGGKYGRKSENLTKKQLKASGGLAAAKKRTVDISSTRREGAVTLGPGGKPLTGTVKLGGGKTAVYKGGKRVQKSVAKKEITRPRTTSTVTAKPKPKPKPTVTRVSPSRRQEGAGGRGSMTAAQANRLGAEGPRSSKNVPVTMSPKGARPTGNRKTSRRSVRGSDGYVYMQRRVNGQWVTFDRQKVSR